MGKSTLNSGSSSASKRNGDSAPVAAATATAVGSPSIPEQRLLHAERVLRESCGIDFQAVLADAQLDVLMKQHQDGGDKQPKTPLLRSGESSNPAVKKVAPIDIL